MNQVARIVIRISGHIKNSRACASRTFSCLFPYPLHIRDLSPVRCTLNFMRSAFISTKQQQGGHSPQPQMSYNCIASAHSPPDTISARGFWNRNWSLATAQACVRKQWRRFASGTGLAESRALFIYDTWETGVVGGRV